MIIEELVQSSDGAWIGSHVIFVDDFDGQYAVDAAGRVDLIENEFKSLPLLLTGEGYVTRHVQHFTDLELINRYPFLRGHCSQ